MGLEKILKSVKKDIHRDIRSDDGVQQYSKNYETEIKGHTVTVSYSIAEKKEDPKKDELVYLENTQELRAYKAILQNRIGSDGLPSDELSEDIILKLEETGLNRNQIRAYSAWITMWTEGTERGEKYQEFTNYLKQKHPKLHKNWRRKRAKRR